MELSPVSSYAVPAYPTRDILVTHPELLQSAPERWRRHAVLASVLATSVSLLTPAWSQPTQETTPAPAPITLLEGDNEPRLMGDVFIPVTPVPQGITQLTPPVTATPQSIQATIAIPELRVIREGNVLTAPVRLVAEHLGAQVQFHPQTGETTVTGNGATLTLTPGTTAIVNGNSVPLPAPMRKRNGKLYAPLRFMTETLGGTVQWHEDTHAVDIFAPKGAMLTLHAALPTLAHPLPATQEDRRAALRDYVAWLKAEEMI